MAIAVADIGKSVRDILYGIKDGVFQYDNKVGMSTKTADGVALTLSAVQKGDKADLSLRTVYNYNNYGINALFTTADKVNVTATVDKLAPGVKLSLVANLPDTQSGKLLVDYVNQQVHLKTSVGLTTQPKVTLSAATGYKNLVFGGEATYDTAKSIVSNYGLALGVHAGDSQLAVHLQDMCETLKIVAAHNISKDKAVAAEITRPVSGGDITFHLGIARRCVRVCFFKHSTMPGPHSTHVSMLQLAELTGIMYLGNLCCSATTNTVLQPCCLTIAVC
jgi:voltage-dependent anion channel protein 2